MPRELVVSLTRTLWGFALTLGPSRVLPRIARVLVAALTVAPAAAAERSRIVIVTVPRTAIVERVIVLPIAEGEAGAAARRMRRPVVVIARSIAVLPRLVVRVIEVSGIEIHGAPLSLERPTATNSSLGFLVTNW